MRRYPVLQYVRGGRVHVWREQWREEAKIELVDGDELKTRYLLIEAPDLVGELERLRDAVGDDQERQVVEQAIRDSRETEQ